MICPIISKENSNDASVLLAILGISGTAAEELDDDNRNALQLAIEKARVYCGSAGISSAH